MDKKDIKRLFPESMKMPNAIFWNLIEKSKTNSGFDRQIDILTSELTQCSLEDIQGFECTLREELMKSYHYNILAAAKIIFCDVSDDNFLYFRCRLLVLGKDIYYRSIESPDSIVEELAGELEGEKLLYVADNAFENKIGESDMQYPRDIACEIIDYDNGFYQLLGEDWPYDQLPNKFPKLWEKYKSFI